MTGREFPSLDNNFRKDLWAISEGRRYKGLTGAVSIEIN